MVTSQSEIEKIAHRLAVKVISEKLENGEPLAACKLACTAAIRQGIRIGFKAARRGTSVLNCNEIVELTFVNDHWIWQYDSAADYLKTLEDEQE